MLSKFDYSAIIYVDRSAVWLRTQSDALRSSTLSEYLRSGRMWGACDAVLLNVPITHVREDWASTKFSKRELWEFFSEGTWPDLN